jgi:uncharacterized membrane protein YhaH (DUF805 family)
MVISSYDADGRPSFNQWSMCVSRTGVTPLEVGAVVGSQSFTDQGVTVMVVVVAILGLATLMPLAGVFGRRFPAAAT